VALTRELVFARHANVPSDPSWPLVEVSVDEEQRVYALLSDTADDVRGHAPTRYRVFDLARQAALFETRPMTARLSSVQPIGDEFLLTGAGPLAVFRADVSSMARAD
jgi:hypothetical protein